MVVRLPSDDVRIAHALAIIKARRHFPDTERELHWKKKAKLLKEEVLALRQELLEVEECSTLDKLPSLAPCECLFLNTRLQEMPRPTDSDEHVNKLSVQRFLNNVRILSHAKRNRRTKTGNFKVPLAIDTTGKDLKGHLVLVVDFIVDLLGDTAPLCPLTETDTKTTKASDNKHFSSYMHQSVTFVRDIMPCLLADALTQESRVEASMKKLTSTLSVNIMNFSSEKEFEGKEIIDKRVWSQQVILRLASVPYIGQQFLLTIARLIAEIAETLVCLDPFHEGVTQTYDNLFFMLQLFERLLSDHVCTWAKSSQFNEDHLGETLRYHFQTVKLFHDFGNWSSLAAFYTNRITGEIVAQLYSIVALNHKAEGSKHSALLHLVELATSETKT